VTEYSVGDDPSYADPKIDAHLQAIASIVADAMPEVSKEITAKLVAEVPEMRGDDVLAALLHASVDENVRGMSHLIALQLPAHNVAAPSAALEYTRRLAQRGVSVIALVRSYRVGHAAFLDWCVRQLDARGDEPRLVQAIAGRMVQLSFAYIDQVSEQLVGVYQQERDRWLLTQTAVRASRVRKLLAREDVDVDATEAVLGYRLRQHHLALIGWVPEQTRGGAGLLRLDRLGQTLATDLGCAGRPLFVPFDESIAWLWLPLGGRAEIDQAALSRLVAQHDPTIHVAVGQPDQGVAGFRASHLQAATARGVAMAADPPHRVTLTERVGPIALLCADLEATRVWVHRTLGKLAADEPNLVPLRETLRVFLECGSSYTAAADTLNLHRNTVQYRMNRARNLLPGPITDQRSDIQLALRACDELGSVLLRDPQ